MKLHVVHLSSVHPANDTRIFHKQCISLQKAGYRVTLIAKSHKEETRDGVAIIPVGSYGRNRFERMTRGVLDVYRKALQQQGDVYHLHDAELLPIGALLRASGKKVIYDSHEDLVDQIKSKPWIPRRLRGLVSALAGAAERLCTCLFSAIIIANPLQGHRFPVGKTVCVQNFPLLSEVRQFGDFRHVLKDKSVTYVGGLSEIRGVNEMVKSIAIVNDSMPVTLQLGGWFSPPTLESNVSKLPGWKFTIHLGPLSREEVIDVLRRSNVGLVVVHPIPNFLTNQPVKLFEYMMAGLPIVASNIPSYRQFVEDLGTGILVDPLCPREIAEAIIWLLKNPAEAGAMGQRGRDAVLSKYNWDYEACKLVDLYESVLS